MRPRLSSLTLALGLLPLVAAPTVTAQNPYRLKPGGGREICLGCHSDFAEKLKSKFVHTPVKEGDCSDCHSPHTSNHGKLLAASPNAVCFTCHPDIVPEKTVSGHKVVVEGNCVRCHDPHASNNPANLVKVGNDLCLSCHKDVGSAIAAVKFKHIPVSNDCLSCHNPHGSDKAVRLLKSPVPTLCLQCHKADSARFVSQHANYPVAKANCASCHNPHGSDVAGILFDTVHPPVASRRCNQCHNAPDATAPFATRRLGFELCRGCHSAMVNDVFTKSRVHWPVVSKNGCLSCHEAHASRGKKLLSADGGHLCGKCHKDTADWQVTLGERERQEKAAAKTRVIKGSLTHAPIQQGTCSACHAPHASDSVNLLREPSVIDGCGACHDWLKHTTHPMGDKFADMRNKNLTVNCLSCHRAHGTGYRYMIPFPESTELCVQCHRQMRR